MIYPVARASERASPYREQSKQASKQGSVALAAGHLVDWRRGGLVYGAWRFLVLEQSKAYTHHLELRWRGARAGLI